jgi:hypothetical protein
MEQNYYVISQNISTDINGTNLNFTLGNSNPTNSNNLPIFPHNNLSFSIHNPANTDITTFSFGSQITMTLVTANT